MSRFFGKKKGAATEDDEVNRNNLFGNRTAQNPPSNSHSGHVAGNPYAPQRGGYDPGYGGAPPADYGTRGDNAYGGSSYAAQNPYAPHRGGYDDRFREDPSRGYGQQQQEQSGGYGQSGASQRSEEYDSEEENIKEAKRSIQYLKGDTRDSTKRSVAAALAAQKAGMETLGRLSAQGGRLHNTEKNLDIARNQNYLAEEKARELKTLNRSMFVPNVGNPLRSKSRTREEEAKIIARHELEREEAGRTREFGYESKNVVGRALNTATGRVESKGKSSLAERSRYQFEADSDDDRMEDEIDDNLDQLGAITGQLKGIAMATSKEVDRQNQQIDKIMKKSDRVDDQIALNHNRLRKIH